MIGKVVNDGLHCRMADVEKTICPLSESCGAYFFVQNTLIDRFIKIKCEQG